jgi:hypothetical protein
LQTATIRFDELPPCLAHGFAPLPVIQELLNLSRQFLFIGYRKQSSRFL